MALGNTTIQTGLLPGTCVSTMFNRGGAHDGHPFMHIGPFADTTGQVADAYYCKTDNKILLENG